MSKRQQVQKMVAMAMVLSLFAVACGGGSSESADDLDGQAPPAVSFDEEVDASSDPAPIATTAPIPLAEAPAAEEAAAPSDVTVSGIEEDPWEVDVLHVNDDAVLIPTFDGPNGNPTTLFDINEVDGGTRLEYPLFAETVFGNRLALLVEEFDSSGAWAKVQVPIRPNGTTAWVQTAFFTTETHNYHITIDVSEGTVNVYQGDNLIVEQIAVLGREGRATPVVRSYIDEKIAGASLSPAYGDWVLSIAAYSEALGTFGGGMPKLALHGTNQPELMGQFVSSGCVRIPNEVVSLIADIVPVGTIVDIVA